MAQCTFIKFKNVLTLIRICDISPNPGKTRMYTSE